IAAPAPTASAKPNLPPPPRISWSNAGPKVCPSEKTMTNAVRARSKIRSRRVRRGAGGSRAARLGIGAMTRGTVPAPPATAHRPGGVLLGEEGPPQRLRRRASAAQARQPRPRRDLPGPIDQDGHGGADALEAVADRLTGE